MVFSKVASAIRHSLLPLFLLGLWESAHAGPEPTPTDWIPRFTEVRIEGRDIVFDAGITRIRLADGQFGKPTSTPINNLVEHPSKYTPKNAACSIPKEVLSHYKSQYNSPEILLCDLPDRVWFATGGYCGEGDDEPALNQGSLYSYSTATGEVTSYPGTLPKCAEVGELARANNRLVAVTLYQEEYSQSAGEVIILDLENIKAPPRRISNPRPTGAVVGMSVYDKQCDCVWFATETGIERLTIGSGEWQQQYFDYVITADNHLALTLSPTAPRSDRMWLGRVLYNYPIENLREFIKGWAQSPAQQYSEHPRVGPVLLPYYIAAAETAKQREKDWPYSELVRIVAMHKDNESKATVRAFIEEQLKQTNSLSRRGEAFSIATYFNIQYPQALSDRYFDDLLADYFSRYEGNSSSRNDVVRISFENPELLPKLKAYYLTHPVTFDVEKDFLDRMAQYSSWPAYASMAEMVNARNKRIKRQYELLDMCNRAAFFSNDRSDQQLVRILDARLETDAQATFTIRKRNNPNSTSVEDGCIRGSEWWLAAPDNVRPQRVTQLLNVSDKRKEYKPLVLEILNKRFGTSFTSLEEWQRWWAGTHKN